MPDFTQGRDLTPGFIARVAAGARFMLTGRAPADWFGPEEPQAPVAPPEVAGRQWDFPPGYNLVVRPRAYEPIGFPQLRALADSYDLLRLVIETRKDQLSRLRWSISPRDQGKRAKDDPRCGSITDFLAYPDREHGWDEWIRMLVEDMLVLDAATIYPRRTLGGGIYALEPIDGATIKRVIDDHGRTPLPPDPAFQQVLKGLPATSYTKDELYYLPRNPRTDRVYGCSPVEQIIMSVNIALRRQMHQLQYYTEGSVPDSLIGVPETWSPDQIGQFQAYWDALLEGNTAQRRHARFVPATISKSFVQTKDAALKDEYDEWLARIICYAFNVSNQWAVRQMNRATADTAQEQSQREGLEPLMKWVKGMMDRILARTFQAPDLEFQWAEEEQVDPGDQATVNKLYLSAGVRSINEVRQDLGLDPIPGGEVHLIYTAQGAVPLADVVRGAVVAKAYNPDEPRIPAGNPGGGQWTSTGDSGSATAAVPPIRVASSDAIQTDAPTLQTAQAEDDDERNNAQGAENDPLAETRLELWRSKYQQLQALDPSNPNLAYASSPDWVPTEHDLDQMDQAIEAAATKRVSDFIAPGGQLIGTQGGGLDVREAPGGLPAAQQAFDYLRVGGQDVTPPGYPGTLVKLPGNAGFVGLRPSSSDGTPALDVKSAGRYMKIHYP